MMMNFYSFFASSQFHYSLQENESWNRRESLYGFLKQNYAYFLQQSRLSSYHQSVIAKVSARLTCYYLRFVQKFPRKADTESNDIIIFP